MKVFFTPSIDHIYKTVREKNIDILLLDVSSIYEAEEKEVEFLLKSIPTLVLSSKSIYDTTWTVYAITKGAEDFILYEDLDKEAYLEEVLKKIDKALPESVKNKGKKSNSKNQSTLKASSFDYIVAIGTSTGGPKALQTVLSKLPKDFPAPLVIVQHMPSGFTKSLAKRLNEQCHITVKEAVDGESLEAGKAYIAPGNYHMEIKEDFTILINQKEERSGHRPSVNVLLESIAGLDDLKKIVVILTGMGKDGAEGVEKIKQIDKRATIVVESVETAVIYGMPRAVIKTGHVDKICRLDQISSTIIDYIVK